MSFVLYIFLYGKKTIRSTSKCQNISASKMPVHTINFLISPGYSINVTFFCWLLKLKVNVIRIDIMNISIFHVLDILCFYDEKKISSSNMTKNRTKKTTILNYQHFLYSLINWRFPNKHFFFDIGCNYIGLWVCNLVFNISNDEARFFFSVISHFFLSCSLRHVAY